MVMTAYGDREVFKTIRKLGGMNIIVKPIDLQWMKEMLVAFFEEKQVFLETLDTIDLTSILQVINLEKKTITIKVEMNGNYGFLYFEDGELINSEYDRLTGEEAAVKLLTSNKGKFSLIKTQKRIERKIEVPFIHFLVNIMKDIDHDRIRRKWRSTWNGKIEKKPGIQIDETIFKDLKVTSGFKGAGIYSKDGNLIVEESLDLINIEELGLLGLDLCESAIHKIQRNQLGKLELLHIQTDKMILVFSWLVFREIFIAVIIDIEGNLGIVKHRIKNISQSIDDYIKS
jgi:predicted regulator of Ras-like GTPase activity (Roadblock/LC7/MglB family)